MSPALALEIVARWLGSKPCPTLQANRERPKLVTVPTSTLGFGDKKCFALAGTWGKYWQWGIFGRGTHRTAAEHLLPIFSHIYVLSVQRHPLYMARMD